MPKNHRLAQLEEIPIQELREDPFISLLQSSAHDIHRALDNAGVRPNIKFTTKDDYAVIAMVEQGIALSTITKFTIQPHSKVKALPIDPPCSRILGVSYHKKNCHDKLAAAKFLKCIKRWKKKREEAEE